ncbi:MAG: hypothetical protein E6J85_16705 [Deltaproteobacteria bacterium]|nr:MAG: hypothetical protein E6J85_16705 [Deltaproteobacteria bacterium]
MPPSLMMRAASRVAPAFPAGSSAAPPLKRRAMVTRGLSLGGRARNSTPLIFSFPGPRSCDVEAGGEPRPISSPATRGSCAPPLAVRSFAEAPVAVAESPGEPPSGFAFSAGPAPVGAAAVIGPGLASP